MLYGLFHSAEQHLYFYLSFTAEAKLNTLFSSRDKDKIWDLILENQEKW